MGRDIDMKDYMQRVVWVNEFIFMYERQNKEFHIFPAY